VNRKWTNPGAEETRIRPFHPADIPEVVNLHLGILPANSGRRFHERALYPTICHPASTGYGFVQVHDGKVVGFIVGIQDTSAWRWTLVRTQGLECLLAATRTMLKERGAFLKAVKRARRFMTNPSAKPEGHIFAVAIDKAYRNRGLGLQLLKALVEYCRSHEMACLWTRTLKANVAYRRLVTNCGFRFHEELSIGGESYVVYCLDFDKSGGSE
jgi:ribosomal protein S18 acetylase RimI-like enzyme